MSLPDTVVDASHWQAPFDVNALKAAGIQAVLHKAGQGIGFIDPTYALRRPLAQAAGLAWGAYWFGDNADGTAQADKCLSVVNPDGTTTLALDLEAGMTLSQAQAFISRVKARTGSSPILYTSAYYVHAIGGDNDPTLLGCQVWIADPNHTDAPTLPIGFTSWLLWQHGSNQIGGVTYDRNYAKLPLPTYNLITPPAPKPPVTLAVPDIVQYGVTADAYKNDCGVACVCGMGKFYGLPMDTIDVMAAKTSLSRGDKGLYSIELVWLAALYNLTLVVKSAGNADLTAELDAGRPVIALVWDPLIPGIRPTGDHFLIVRGYDDTGFICNDPNQDASTGNGLHVAYGDMAAALSHDGYGGQAVFVTGHATPPPPPPASNEVTMYVNTPPLADGTVQHLIVHSQVPNGADRYIVTDSLQPNSPNGELRDQTVVKVLLPPTQGSDKSGNPVAYVQIAPDDSPIAGYWLEYDLLATTPRGSVSVPPAPTTGNVAKLPTSIIGAHYLAGGEWITQDMKTLSDSGTPLSSITILRQGFGSDLTPATVKSISPHTLTVERWYWSPAIDWTQDNSYQAGYDLVTQYVARFPVDHHTDYHQIVNEPVVIKTAATVSFWNGALDAANKIGIKLTVLNTPYFWPALPGETRQDGADTTFWTADVTHALLRRIIAEGHILAMHEYLYPDPNGTWDSGPMQRHEQAVKLLPTDCQTVPIVLTEYGTGKGNQISDAQLIAGFAVGDKLLHSGIANVRGAMAWAFGGSNMGWKNSDLGSHRAALVKYWQNAKF